MASKPNEHDMTEASEVNFSATVTCDDLSTSTETEAVIAEETENAASETTEDTVVAEESEPEWLDILGSGGIMKKILKTGVNDTKPRRLQKCLIKYYCSLKDGEIVDSNEKFEIYLGDCDVIQGLDVAIALMNLNERCLLKIEPRLAFGSRGLPPNIPPGTIVTYDVELLAVYEEEDAETLSVLQRKEIGNKKRERGNWWYGRGENTLAIQCYRRALDFLDEVEGGITQPTPDGQEAITDTDLQNLLELRISVYNNMAAAQIKMELYDPALNSLQTVLRCQPGNIKALFRKAKVLTAKNDLSGASKCLQKARDLSPCDADIQKQINHVTHLMQKQKVTERELAKRMFNGLKNDLNGKSQKKHTKSNLRLWATIGATVFVGVASVAAYRFKYA